MFQAIPQSTVREFSCFYRKWRQSHSRAIWFVSIVVTSLILAPLSSNTSTVQAADEAGRASTQAQNGTAPSIYLPLVVSPHKSEPQLTQSPKPSPAGSQLIEGAETAAHMRVIVRLATTDLLASASGVLLGADTDAQRGIAAVRTQVLADLAAVTVLDEATVTGFTYLPLMALDVTPEQLQALANHPSVVAIVEDEMLDPEPVESSMLMGSESTWTQSYSGAGQTIAVIDSGVDSSHPALAGKIVAEACFSSSTTSGVIQSLCPNGQETQIGPGAGRACPDSMDGCAHGTHVAGIVAGRGHGALGVARDATLIAVQVFSQVNDETYCSQRDKTTPCTTTFVSDYMKGLEYVYSVRASFSIAAVNMSLSGKSYSSQVECDLAMSLNGIKPLVDALRTASIAVVASAGNSGLTNAIGRPGCVSSAISVGATTKRDGVATFSNSAPILDLLAPGEAIVSSVPGGKTAIFSGTSMASPQVAGAWAVLKSKRPDASVDQILTILTKTGLPIRDARNGVTKPRIQIDAALKSLLGNGPVAQVGAANLSFGIAALSSASAPLTVTVTNEGDAPLILDAMHVAGAAANDYLLDRRAGCLATDSLPSRASCTITVHFTPQDIGPRNATLIIETNAPDSPHRVGLAGGSQPEPKAQLSTAKLVFDAQTVGRLGDSKTITVTNHGSADLIVAEINAIGDFAQSNHCAATIAAGASCAIQVEFRPAAPGDRQGTLTLATNAPHGPQTILLSGVGISPDVVSGIGHVSLAQGGGGNIVSLNGQIRAMFPTDAGTQAMTITLQTSAQPPDLGSYVLLDSAFDISAIANDGARISKFTQPFTLTLTYADSELHASKIAAKQDLNFYYWDSKRWRPILPCAGCVHDVENHRISVKVDNLTPFALLTTIQTEVYLPLVMGK